MKIGKTLIYWYKRSEHNRFWMDVRFKGWWYVLIWRRTCWPFLYCSRDATPPSSRPKETLWGETNEGKMIFGKYSD